MQIIQDFAGSTVMWSTQVGGHLTKVVNLTGFTVYAKNCFLGQATDIQLPVRHLDTTQDLDFVHHLFKNTKTELSIDPLELIVAHLFDELN